MSIILAEECNENQGNEKINVTEVSKEVLQFVKRMLVAPPQKIAVVVCACVMGGDRMS